MPRIVVERGSEKGVSLSLPPDGSVVVGRSQTCGLVLTDWLASRQHFKIAADGERYFIEDLKSHNGTWLNSEKIGARTELKIGATIRAGETLLVFRAGEREEDRGALAGRRVGGYHVLERIGTGGMGEVYKAQQVALGRTVALKILAPELLADRGFVEKFQREARAAGKLNHPNVIQVHEVGESEGIYFYSMEFVDGGSVQDLAGKRNKLEPQRATEIVLQAARALQFAEKAGIVHCDIKPDNLMLTAAGDVRLADLGISQTLNEKGKAEQSEGVFGSPHYMSPEQARGLPLDHRSDLYSLGVTWYRILLGRLPFTGKDAREIMEKQVFDEPVHPRLIDGSLPPLVYSTLTRLLKKRPAERYQSATALIADLEAALEQLAHPESVPSAPNMTPKKMSRYRRRPSSFWGF